MKKISSITFLIIIFSAAYYYQIGHYAKKYHNLYLDDISGFSISDSIINAKKLQYENKLLTLRNTVIELQGNFTNQTAASSLLSDLRHAIKTKEVKALDRHKNSTSPEFIEGVKKTILNNEKITGDINQLHAIAKKDAEETARKLTIITSKYRTHSREKKGLLLNLSDFEYFSVVTSTTTGYGDITPITNEVRLLIKNQVIFSLILIGLLVSLISLLITELLNLIFKNKVPSKN
ncbi:putative membrane protein [Halobacteriovorax marinus SJ]|uniref:Membrane protein n=1 Tax=Halobacteriovorax marinus (strain ATCC BAA-682 / DSM 15412 / SJ) TaxID=862908 RepID=E1WXY1_HALMS|nr:potassium channel family protein [Halobacteriovorax marinus]CBW25938.1 putative membrane protein [Halobacteriovorax marinus SJ]